MVELLLLSLDCFNIFAVFLPLPFGLSQSPPSPLSARVLLDGKLPRLRAACERTMSTAVLMMMLLVLAAMCGDGDAGGSSCRLNSVRHNCVQCLLLLLFVSPIVSMLGSHFCCSQMPVPSARYACCALYAIAFIHITSVSHRILGVRANCGKVSFCICVFIYVLLLLLLFQLFSRCCSFCPSHLLPFHCSFCLNFHRVLFCCCCCCFALSFILLFFPRFRFHFLSFPVLLAVCAQFSVRPTLKLNIKRNERPK